MSGGILRRAAAQEGTENGGYVNYGPAGPHWVPGTGLRLTEEERFAEAEQKCQTGERWDRMEGRIESLLQDRLHGPVSGCGRDICLSLEA